MISVVKVRTSKESLLFQEACCLDNLCHPNIVKKITFFQNPHYAILQLEKIKGEALIDRVERSGALPEVELRIICLQLVDCLMYLSSKNIIYLDLKPDNMMYNHQTKHLTLVDFEYALNWTPSTVFRTKDFITGTEGYTSPEVEKGYFYGPEAQMWSFGITLFVLSTGYFPKWKTIEPKVQESSTIFPLLGDKKSKNKPLKLEIEFPDTISHNLRDLIERMLDLDPFARITLDSVQNHAWMTGGG